MIEDKKYARLMWLVEELHQRLDEIDLILKSELDTSSTKNAPK